MTTALNLPQYPVWDGGDYWSGVTDNTYWHYHKVKAVTDDDDVTDNTISHCEKVKAVTEVILCSECGAEPELLHIDLQYHVSVLGITSRTRWETPICEKCAAETIAKAPKWWPIRFLQAKCDHCGRELRYHHETRRRYLHFCSDRCQQDYYNQLDAVKRANERGTRTCSTCGTTFTPKRKDSQYCSNACRQKAYRGRKHD